MLRSLIASVRSIRRRPGFAFTVIATLALGIAPSGTIFTIVDAIYFRPLPYPSQERLILVNLSQKSDASLIGPDAFTFSHWTGLATSFEALAAYRSAGFNVTVEGSPERLSGQLVTAGFFRALGIMPALGRPIADGDCVQGAPPVLVISDRAWRELLGGRSDVVNVAVRFNGLAATVVGVMPPSFKSFMEGRTASAWAPLALPVASAPGSTPVGNVIGRLKPGVTIAQAEAEIANAQATLASSFPDATRDRAVVVRGFRDALFGGLGPGLKMLTVIIGLLLLIACANAANLLLDRVVSTERDVAVRAALGASRWRLFIGSLAESLALSVAAVCVGLLLAFWATRLVWARSAPIFTRIGVDGFVFDGRVALFGIALAVLTAMLFGAVPALRGSRADLASALKTGTPLTGRGPHFTRLGRILVIGQVALCVATLVVTALIVRSFLHFSRVSSSPGFEPKALYLATLPPADEEEQPPATLDPRRLSPQIAARISALREIEVRLSAEPGLESAALTSAIPFLESGAAAVLQRAAGEAGQGVTPRLAVDARYVNPAYFSALSVRALKGRTLKALDAGNPVVVIDERVAAAMWGAGDPVGDQVVVDRVLRTVVGVVRASIEPSPFRPAGRDVFLPSEQSGLREMKLLVRSYLPSEAALAAIRRSVAAVDRDQPLTAVGSFPEALDDFMTPFRLILALITVFGATAVGLAALGLYSVTSRAVSRRTREIGIRVASGASRSNILTMVMGDGLTTAGIGVVVGLLLGLAGAAILPSEILGVRGLAGWHYLAAAVICLGAASIACLIPARRASAVQPSAALRYE